MARYRDCPAPIWGATRAAAAGEARAYLLSKIAAVFIVAAVTAWGATVAAMLKDFNNLTAHFDWVVHLVQLLGIAAFLAGFVFTVLNLRAVWSGQRRWPAKTWSVVLVVSAGIVLWVAFVFHLIGFGVDY